MFANGSFCVIFWSLSILSSSISLSGNRRGLNSLVLELAFIRGSRRILMQPITDEIIEISFLRVASWSRRYPVTFMDLRFVLVPGDLRAKLRAGWQHWVRLLAAVCRGRYRLVICRSFGRFIYRPDLPIVLNAVRFLLILFIKAGIRVWQARGAELVIVDTSDPGVIDPSDLFLLDRCKFYFKRELPQNAWYIFARVQPRYREPHDTIIDPIFIKRLKKFRPLSLGISEEKLERIDGVLAARRTDEKDHDVFFCGCCQSLDRAVGGTAAPGTVAGARIQDRSRFGKEVILRGIRRADSARVAGVVARGPRLGLLPAL